MNADPRALTRTEVGTHSIALLASIIDTCRLRQANATDLLARAIHAARTGLPTPALPPIPLNLSTPSTLPLPLCEGGGTKRLRGHWSLGKLKWLPRLSSAHALHQPIGGVGLTGLAATGLGAPNEHGR